MLGAVGGAFRRLQATEQIETYLLSIGISGLYMVLQALHKWVVSVINGISYDLFERTAKTFVNRLNISPQISIARQHPGIVRHTAFLNGGKELRRVRPGQSHVGRTGRPAVKPDPPAINDHRPFKVPVVKHPERLDARFTDVLSYQTVPARQDKRLLDEPSRCAL